MTHELERLEATVRRALASTLEDETDLHLRVSVMLAAGVSRQDVQQRLGLTGDDLRAILGRLKRCADRLHIERALPTGGKQADEERHAPTSHGR